MMYCGDLCGREADMITERSACVYHPVRRSKPRPRTRFDGKRLQVSELAIRRPISTPYRERLGCVALSQHDRPGERIRQTIHAHDRRSGLRTIGTSGTVITVRAFRSPSSAALAPVRRSKMLIQGGPGIPHYFRPIQSQADKSTKLPIFHNRYTCLANRDSRIPHTLIRFSVWIPARRGVLLSLGRPGHAGPQVPGAQNIASA